MLPFFINVSRNFSVQFALWKWNQRSVNWSQSQHSRKKSIFAKAQIVRKSRTAHLFDIFRSQVWEKSSTFCKARVMFLFYSRRQFERVKDDWEETTFQIFRTKSSPSFCTAHTVHCRIKFWNQKTRKREVGQFQVIRQQNKSKLRDHSFNKYFLIRVFSRKISLTEFLSEESKNLEEVKAVGRFSKVVKLNFFCDHVTWRHTKHKHDRRTADLKITICWIWQKVFFILWRFFPFRSSGRIRCNGNRFLWNRLSGSFKEGAPPFSAQSLSVEIFQLFYQILF